MLYRGPHGDGVQQKENGVPLVYWYVDDHRIGIFKETEPVPAEVEFIKLTFLEWEVPQYIAIGGGKVYGLEGETIGSLVTTLKDVVASAQRQLDVLLDALKKNNID
jgi:hypothetical protein